VRILRFIFDVTVEIIKGFREDWREVKRETRDDLRSVLKGTPEP
jgi:hypothetical protein